MGMGTLKITQKRATPKKRMQEKSLARPPAVEPAVEAVKKTGLLQILRAISSKIYKDCLISVLPNFDPVRENKHDRCPQRSIPQSIGDGFF